MRGKAGLELGVVAGLPSLVAGIQGEEDRHDGLP